MTLNIRFYVKSMPNNISAPTQNTETKITIHQ